MNLIFVEKHFYGILYNMVLQYQTIGQYREVILWYNYIAGTILLNTKTGKYKLQNEQQHQ